MSYFYSLVALVILGTACIGDWSRNDKKEMGIFALILISMAIGHKVSEESRELKDRVDILERKVRKYHEST